MLIAKIVGGIGIKTRNQKTLSKLLTGKKFKKREAKTLLFILTIGPYIWQKLSE